MNQEIKTALERVAAKAEKEAVAWIKEQEEDVPRKIRSILETRLEKIVDNLLGYKINTWGELELSTYNTTFQNSFTQPHFKTSVNEAAQDMLAKALADKPSIPEAILKSLRSSYIREIKQSFTDLVGEQAFHDAKDLLDSMYAEFRGDNE